MSYLSLQVQSLCPPPETNPSTLLPLVMDRITLSRHIIFMQFYYVIIIFG